MLLQLETDAAVCSVPAFAFPRAVSLLPVTSNEQSSVRPSDEPKPNVVKSLRVLIADDHEAVRRGLRSAVWGAGWEVCGEATNGREAVAKAKELKPDVVILDVSMPVMGGLEAAPEILRYSPDTRIVAFTMHESQQIRTEMFRIGVHGVAVKSASLSNLLDTIKSVLPGGQKA